MNLIVKLSLKTNTINKVNYRYKIIYKFPILVLDDLLKLAKRSPPDNLDVFKKDYEGFWGTWKLFSMNTIGMPFIPCYSFMIAL